MTLTPAYREPLGLPVRCGVQGTMLVATFWLAVVVAMPALAAWLVTAAMVAVLVFALWAYGSPQLVVSDGTFRAGRAHIDAQFLGAAAALDAEQTRRAAGVDADARAYLVLRPYLKRAVKVEITDPADPAPYWLVGTRHPEDLARALTALTHAH